MLLEQREQQLYADYNQFYVQDSNAPGNTGDPAFWTERAFSDKLALVDGIIGIGTVTYGDVRVRSEVHDSAPQFDLGPMGPCDRSQSGRERPNDSHYRLFGP